MANWRMTPDCVSKNILYVAVTNISEFEQLIKTANKKADELREIIHQLEGFNLKVEFSSK